jgi:phosphatidylglycerophosphate synthase
VSAASVAFSLAAGAAFVLVPHAPAAWQAVLLVAAAAAIQLRLLANLLDGLLAVEGGLASQTGELWNDVPDRVADVAILVAAGYATDWEWLGWTAAAGALLTAYTRVLGGALGTRQYFDGPMAKQHRMALVTAACLLSLLELAFGFEGRLLAAALMVVAAGSLLTAVRRLRLVAGELRAR